MSLNLEKVMIVQDLKKERKRYKSGRDRWGHIAAVYQQKLYIMGGKLARSDPKQTDLIFRFDFEQGGFQNAQSSHSTLQSNKQNCPEFRDSCQMVQVDQKCFVYGGMIGEKIFDDVWCLELETLQWKKLEMKGSIPLKREGHSLNLLKQYLILHAGWECSSEQFYQDFHSFDTRTNVWSPIRMTDSCEIGSRESHSCDIIQNLMYVFGGEGQTLVDSSNYYNDIYRVRFDEVQDEKELLGRIEILHPQSKLPPPRASHSSVNVKHFIFICGGECSSDQTGGNSFNSYQKPLKEEDIICRNDLWAYDTLKNVWFEIKLSEENAFAPRISHTLSFYQDQLVIFGGMNKKEIYDDLVLIPLVFEKNNQPEKQQKQKQTSSITINEHQNIAEKLKQQKSNKMKSEVSKLREKVNFNNDFICHTCKVSIDAENVYPEDPNEPESDGQNVQNVSLQQTLLISTFYLYSQALLLQHVFYAFQNVVEFFRKVQASKVEVQLLGDLSRYVSFRTNAQGFQSIDECLKFFYRQESPAVRIGGNPQANDTKLKINSLGNQLLINSLRIGKSVLIISQCEASDLRCICYLSANKANNPHLNEQKVSLFIETKKAAIPQTENYYFERHIIRKSVEKFFDLATALTQLGDGVHVFVTDLVLIPSKNEAGFIYEIGSHANDIICEYMKHKRTLEYYSKQMFFSLQSYFTYMYNNNVQMSQLLHLSLQNERINFESYRNYVQKSVLGTVLFMKESTLENFKYRIIETKFEKIQEKKDHFKHFQGILVFKNDVFVKFYKPEKHKKQLNEMIRSDFKMQFILGIIVLPESCQLDFFEKELTEFKEYTSFFETLDNSIGKLYKNLQINSQQKEDQLRKQIKTSENS